jgi:hypothetical protein
VSHRHWFRILYLCILQYWGLNLQPIPWATPPTLYCDGFFRNMISRTVCWNLIFTSWVARITGVSHQHPARLRHFHSHTSI